MTEAKADQRAGSLTDAIAHVHRSISSLDRLSSSLPVDEEFHFFFNFAEFREPVHGIQERIDVLLSRISLASALSRAPSWPLGGEDDAEEDDWLVSTQEEILEQVDSALDAFKRQRAKQGLQLDDDGFMFQNPTKRRKRVNSNASVPKNDVERGDAIPSVMQKDVRRSERCPIPFHVWSIPRPQDKFDARIDNSNTPFKHPTHLSRSADDSCYHMDDPQGPRHPLKEQIENLDIDGMASTSPTEPKKCHDMSKTPFTFVNTLTALKHLADKLLQEREIAVDLEHNQFRTFQGLTCLMQISTRSEDFIIDTLELRSYIGHQLQDVFANANIQKVMHGADCDVVWLQRDFGIYVCNLFDTGQAARVLGFKSFSLSYILEQFCGVVPDKRYQMADWRLRPLTVEMMKYAREDTHYLLYLRDILIQMLLTVRCGDLEGQESLKEVLRRSRDISLKLYEKEITTENSYLQVFGLQEKQFQAEQRAVLAGLYAWRDNVARAEDESTGYVLPNHLLLKLAEEMPDTVEKLRGLLKSKHSLVARNISTLVNIIKKSRLMASMYENVTEVLGKSSVSASFKEIHFDKRTSEAEKKQTDTVMLLPERTDNTSNAACDEVMDLSLEGPCLSSARKMEEVLPMAEPHVHLQNNVITCSSGMDVKVPSMEAILKRKKVTGLGSLFGKKPESVNDSLEEVLAKNTSVVEVERPGKTATMASNVAGVPSSQIQPSAIGSCTEVNIKLQTKETITKRRDVKELATFFGKSFKKPDSSSEDLEQAIAKSKIEKIRASFTLPFHSFRGTDESEKKPRRKDVKGQQMALEEQTGKFLDHNEWESEEIILIEPSPPLAESICEEKGISEEVIPVDSGPCIPEAPCQEGSLQFTNLEMNGIGTFDDGSQHRWWWPDVLQSTDQSSTQSEDINEAEYRSIKLPISVSEKYRQKGREDTKKFVLYGSFAGDSASKLMSSYKAKSELGDATFEPFDYAAAKMQRSFHKGLYISEEGSTGLWKANHSEQRRVDDLGKVLDEKVFNPHRRLEEFRPDGISPGKRRQVFPQSGNRTGVFKYD